jgi:flagellar biosynthesis/type III secretory pathway chaperone
VNFKRTLLDADAQLLTQGRIPGEQVLKVMKERIASGGRKR